MEMITSPISRILKEIKENSPRSQLIIGTIIGFITAVPSLKIAKALAIFTGGIMLAISIKNDCNGYLDLSQYSNINLSGLVELVKRNGSLSTGFIAGCLIGFSYV